MADQNTTRAAAYVDIHGSGREPVAGKQAPRRALLKVSGRLIAGAAAYVSPAAAAPCAIAADDGPRYIVKRDLQTSSLVSSIAEFVHGTRFGDLSETVRRVARQHLLGTVGCCLAAVRLETSRSLASYLVSEGARGVPQSIQVFRHSDRHDLRLGRTRLRVGTDLHPYDARQRQESTNLKNPPASPPSR